MKRLRHCPADKDRPAGCETAPAPPHLPAPAMRPPARRPACAAGECPRRSARPQGPAACATRFPSRCCPHWHRCPWRPHSAAAGPAPARHCAVFHETSCCFLETSCCFHATWHCYSWPRRGAFSRTQRAISAAASSMRGPGRTITSDSLASKVQMRCCFTASSDCQPG